MVAIAVITLLVAAAAAAWHYTLRRGGDHVRNGIFLEKYQHLIQLLTEKRRSEFINIKNHSLTLRITLNKDQHFFTISEVDDRLVIVWKLQSSIYGRRGKEWSFNLAYSQVKMYQEIVGDIRNYQELLRKEKPFSGESNLSAV